MPFGGKADWIPQTKMMQFLRFHSNFNITFISGLTGLGCKQRQTFLSLLSFLGRILRPADQGPAEL